MLPWGAARVRGESMSPTLAPGDLLWVRYGRRPRPGSVVVARFVDGTLAVKRVSAATTTRAGEPAWWLLSDDPSVGVDSRHRGPVAEPDVWAVAVARIWPRPSLLRPPPR